jgi:hypothetical protein
LIGLFNALNGLGAGGQVDSQTSANSNAALYAIFTVSAFFAGYVCVLYLSNVDVDIFHRSINNKIGVRLTLFLGYGLYIASYL